MNTMEFIRGERVLAQRFALRSVQHLRNDVGSKRTKRMMAMPHELHQRLGRGVSDVIARHDGVRGDFGVWGGLLHDLP
jgi:hypothetical protein